MNNEFQISEYLPFLIPFIVIEAILLIAALVHIFRHEHYNCGNRIIWIVVVIIGSSCLLGPILYFVLGKENE